MPVVPALLAFALGLALVLALAVGLITYNSVVALQKRADKAWANVEVALRQRHDELPNLVEAVRGIMAFERDVLEEVTRRRAAYAPADPLARQAATSDATSAAIRSLFAVMEGYPAVRSHENVSALQDEIERLETLIAARREFYNDSVYLHNATIRQAPAVFLAGLFGWQPRDFFEAEPDERRRPDISVSGAGTTG
jgi:LemA protein